MDINSHENINPGLEALPLWAWANTIKSPAVKLTAWTINSRLEVVNIICEVRNNG